MLSTALLSSSTTNNNTLLILLSVLSLTAASTSKTSPSTTTIASAYRLTNDDGASTSPNLRCVPSPPSLTPTSSHTTATKSSLRLVNDLRGGGWKDTDEDEYEYYEEYYDEYDDDGYLEECADYYENDEEEEDVKSNKKSSRAPVEEEDYNYVLGTSPTATTKDNVKKQTNKDGGGSRLFGFGRSDNSKNNSNKTNKKNRFMSSTTTKSSRASFVPSLRRAPSSSSHYSARGGSGLNLSGTTAAITTLFSKTTSILSEYISTLSKFVMTLLVPIGTSLKSLASYTYSTLSHWIILGIQLMRDVLDMIWYGPAIDGITTTGVMSRYGGLQGILFGSTLSTVVTAVVGVGLISWMVNAVLSSSSSNDGDEVNGSSGRGRVFRPWTWLRFGRRFNNMMEEEEDEEEDDIIDANPHFSLEPPTVDEELEFISRTFKSANPTSKQRISETIATSNQGPFHRWRTNNRRRHRRHGGEQQSESPKRQRKLTIKSIQKWWKRDSNNMVNGGQPINIIKPNNKPRYSASSKNNNYKNPSITQLERQLQKSEQERAQLQNDVQKLQLRLQKAHSDARNIASQNKWLEKQTSRADQILSRAVEVERKKANEEVERVRGEMKGVLERERLMMRVDSGSIGRGSRGMIGGGNDIDLNRGPERRVMDGVEIVRDVDDYDDDDNDMLDERGRPPWRAM